MMSTLSAAASHALSPSSSFYPLPLPSPPSCSVWHSTTELHCSGSICCSTCLPDCHVYRVSASRAQLLRDFIHDAMGANFLYDDEMIIDCMQDIWKTSAPLGANKAESDKRRDMKNILKLMLDKCVCFGCPTQRAIQDDTNICIDTAIDTAIDIATARDTCL